MSIVSYGERSTAVNDTYTTEYNKLGPMETGINESASNGRTEEDSEACQKEAYSDADAVIA